jgi:hypothetical protein
VKNCDGKYYFGHFWPLLVRPVAFCHEIALDYVSCSPFRVPIARLAAAQAARGRFRQVELALSMMPSSMSAALWLATKHN